MRHDHVLKKLYFDLLTPLGRGGGSGTKYCYHVAAFGILFNLVRGGGGGGGLLANFCNHDSGFMIPCNMTIF